MRVVVSWMITFTDGDQQLVVGPDRMHMDENFVLFVDTFGDVAAAINKDRVFTIVRLEDGEPVA